MDTTLELNTFGFHIYRSATGSFNDAQRLTSALILGQGTGGGDYSFTDTSVINGITYWYWLAEVGTTGQIHYYGPLRVTAFQGFTPQGGFGIFLPLVAR